METPTQECTAAAAYEGRLDRLQSRAPLRVSSQTFATLTNGENADAEDRPAISFWAQVAEECHKLVAPRMADLPPAALQILDRDHTQFLVLLADLYTGRITYGDLARRRAELDASTTSELQALAEQRRRERYAIARERAQAAAQDDQAARNAAIGILMGRALTPAPTVQVPYLPLPARPAVTNCYRGGAYTTCTTR